MTQIERDAAGTLDFLTTFVRRYAVRSEKHRAMVKKLSYEYCLGSSKHDAVVGEFLVRLDHIIEEDEL